MIFARKYFSRILGASVPPLPTSPTPVTLTVSQPFYFIITHFQLIFFYQITNRPSISKTRELLFIIAFLQENYLIVSVTVRVLRAMHI